MVSTTSPATLQCPLLIEGRLKRDQLPTGYGARLDLRIDRLRTPAGWTAVDGGISVTVGGKLAATHGDEWVKGAQAPDARDP